jgi:hypothetical protein
MRIFSSHSVLTEQLPSRCLLECQLLPRTHRSRRESDTGRKADGDDERYLCHCCCNLSLYMCSTPLSCTTVYDYVHNSGTLEQAGSLSRDPTALFCPRP